MNDMNEKRRIFLCKKNIVEYL